MLKLIAAGWFRAIDQDGQSRSCYPRGGAGSWQRHCTVARALAWTEKRRMSVIRQGRGSVLAVGEPPQGPHDSQENSSSVLPSNWMRKDLGMVLDEAGRNGAQLRSLAAWLISSYAIFRAMGGLTAGTTSKPDLRVCERQARRIAALPAVESTVGYFSCG